VELEFVDPVLSQPAGGFALDEAVCEVHGFLGPVFGHLLRPHLLLAAQNVCTDFLAVGAYLRPASEHHFEAYDPQSLVVNPEVVVVAAHDLRTHVAGSA